MTQTTYLLKVNGKPICTGPVKLLQALAVQIPAENSWVIIQVTFPVRVINTVSGIVIYCQNMNEAASVSLDALLNW